MTYTRTEHDYSTVCWYMSPGTKTITYNIIWLDSRMPWLDYRMPWLDYRMPWLDSRMPWLDSRMPWLDSRMPWLDYRMPWLDYRMTITGLHCADAIDVLSFSIDVACTDAQGEDQVEELCVVVLQRLMRERKGRLQHTQDMASIEHKTWHR